MDTRLDTPPSNLRRHPFSRIALPGLLYGMLAGYMYWFPKAFGFRLNERLGWISAGCWIVGFYLAFMPLYVLGLAGMARRTQEVFDPNFRPWLAVALIGALVLFTGLVLLFVQLYVSIRDRHANMVPVGDPWDARGLEWSTASPPPEWNFATVPHVSARDTFYWRKRNNGAYKPADHYRDIELPKNAAGGVVIGVAAAFCSFGLVWHIWWMVGLFGFAGVATVILRSFRRNTMRVIPAAAVEAFDRRWLAQANAARPVPRQLEMSTRNEGLAQWVA